MLADRLGHYVIAAPDKDEGPLPVIAGLRLPLAAALKLSGTTMFATLVESLAQGDARSLHALVCQASLPHGLIWVEFPAEEKERVRLSLLAARGQPLAAPTVGAATAITLGYLLADEAATRQVAISLVVEVIDPLNGPGLVISPWELRIDLPTGLQSRDAPWDADACLDDLEGRMALQPSQWLAHPPPDHGGLDNTGALRAEALSIWSLVALLGNSLSHRIRPVSPADGVDQSVAEFLVLDVPKGPA